MGSKPHARRVVAVAAAATMLGLVVTPAASTLVAEGKRQHSDFIGDVQLSPDGRLIYAAALFRDSVFVINPQSGMVIEEWKTASRPYRILFHPDGMSFFVSGWGDGQVRQHDSNNGGEVNRFSVGPAPMDMAFSTRRPDLYLIRNFQDLLPR